MRKLGDEEWSPATVPGCNFLDLLSAGAIEDPFYRDNETKLQWIEEADWEYTLRFHVSENVLERDCVDLVFEGLNVYADVFLNGVHLRSTDNMFREYRTACKTLIREGENELRILFHSPITRTRPLEQENGFSYPAENDASPEKLSVFTRKAPYQYGWDWGPRFVTSGVWRPVYLESYDRARILSVRHAIDTLNEDEALVEFVVEIDVQESGFFTLSTNCTEQGVDAAETTADLALGQNQLRLKIRIPNPDLWWPQGMGDQPLYTFAIALTHDDVSVSEQSLRIGLRTLEFVQDTDPDGEVFCFRVNGEPVFMRGANYIPQDSFPERRSAADYERVMDDAVDANMNMLRIWGGGIYENDLFYELADERGLLIWQDFMFACTLYPTSDEFLQGVRGEVEHQVRRLRHHACLALWCGNNEVELGIKAWGWPDTFSYDEAWYEKLKQEYDLLFRNLIPRIVETEDPSRRYLSSSPVGDWADVEDDKRGDSHYWGVWHGGEPFEAYEERVPRFMSEFGFQSLPLMESIRHYTEEKDRTIDGSVMAIHQKHSRGNRIIRTHMEAEYGLPEDLDRFAFLSQIQQANGLKKAFSAHRIAKPYCMGTLFWQLNDCWPVASWSCIDYYGRKKALFYEAKRCFTPFAVFLKSRDGQITVHIVNDLLQTVETEVRVTLSGFDGEVHSEKRFSRVIQANSAGPVHAFSIMDLPKPDHRRRQYLHAEIRSGGHILAEDVLLFAPHRELEFERPNIQVDTDTKQGLLNISVVSQCFAPGVYLYTEDEREGPLNLSDNFFTLLPGRRHECEVPLTQRGPNAAFKTRSTFEVCAELRNEKMNQAEPCETQSPLRASGL